jgi:hypothetical protein
MLSQSLPRYTEIKFKALDFFCISKFIAIYHLSMCGIKPSRDGGFSGDQGRVAGK